MKQWWFMKSEMSINKQTIRLMAILFIILMGLFLPWKSSLKIPAVYVSEQYSKIYSPYPAKIEEILINTGAHYVIDTIADLPKVISNINVKMRMGKTPRD